MVFGSCIKISHQTSLKWEAPNGLSLMFSLDKSLKYLFSIKTWRKRLAGRQQIAHRNLPLQLLNNAEGYPLQKYQERLKC